MGTRILYVHGIEAIGGAERDLISLLKTLDRDTWEPHVVCPGTGPFRDLLHAIAVPTHALTLPPWRKLRSFFQRRSAAQRLGALVDQLDPALIHVNDIWWVPHTVRAIASRRSNPVPIVAHVRQEIEPAKVQRYWLDRVEAVIAISRQIEQSLIAGGVAVKKVRTLYSGIDLFKRQLTHDGQAIRQMIGIPDGAVLLGTIANLFPRKGYEVMLQALPAIVRAAPTVHYVIVGTDGSDYADRLKQLAHELKIADRVHIVGFQDPVQPFLASLDLYVHPALMEGFGIAVVEAMAMGKAVVATTTGGLPEVVAQGETGLLVPPGDVESLAATVVSLLQDRVRREQLGRNGSARVHEHFSLDAYVAKVEHLYGQVLAAQKGRG
ncbi:MAG TPA: glycosyltransferase family 4 protein [Nitrospiraceae bacterium]|nr:glycosyltransferase family 4 protein [Nitrospiraceae bacterium]